MTRDTINSDAVWAANLDRLFPLWEADSFMVGDPILLPAGDPRWTERHLQCVWYDDRLRPADLTGEAGERIRVISPGIWNLEAGPDFMNAELRVGDSERLVRGDVEIHVRPADWDHHRHHKDARYGNVVLHVTYYPGTPSIPNLPPHVHRLSLQAGLLSNRQFAFEDIDVGAYPHAVLPGTPRPCGAALGSAPPSVWNALLEAAGKHRLRGKAMRVAARLRQSGDRYQVFYEELMSVLGYKRNSAAFRRVAECLPLAAWSASATPEEHYAHLLGTAGLLPDTERLSTLDAQTFVRGLWDIWFRAGGGAGGLEASIEWKTHSTRPSNHPVRRLAAAASIFHEPRRLLDAIYAVERGDAAAWTKRVLELLTQVEPLPFWERRQSLDSATGARKLALIGKGRAAAMLSNAVLPFMVAENPTAEPLVDTLPPEDLGSPAREAAYRLFGRDHNPVFYQRSGLRQQGLLAIHQTYCLTQRDGCQSCALAGRLREIADSARIDSP